MFSVFEIVQTAHGGQALDSLARQFDISPEQAEAAVKALTPVLSAALLRQAEEPHALGTIFGVLGDSHHVAAFADPAAAQAETTAQKGIDILGYLFGRHDEAETSETVVVRAAATSGLPPELLEKILPVLASMVFGGVAKSLQDQGLGGVLSQLAKASGQGGLGSILGQVLGGQPQTPPAPEPARAPSTRPGGLAGVLASILGGLLARPGSAPPPPVPAPKTLQPQESGFDLSSIQVALDALNKMLQPGAPPVGAPPPRAEAGLHKEIGDILDRKPG